MQVSGDETRKRNNQTVGKLGGTRTIENDQGLQRRKRRDTAYFPMVSIEVFKSSMAF